MSQETNNELELLLRRMGRRDDSGARNAAASVQDQHLDADELSSYAQNALPAAARAHYTAHLAECATCRRLVTELSLSLGAATARVEAAHEPSGWKTFLASLFSPLVLRYAVPAFGVLVVMIVGFVVLRQRNQHQLMAGLQENKAPAVASPQTTPADGFVNTQTQVADKIENGNVKPAEPKRNTDNIAADTGGAASGAAAPAPPPAAKDQPAVAEVKPAVTATPVATAAGAAPAKAAESPQEPPADAETVAKQREVKSEDKKLDELSKEPAPPATRGLATVQPAGRTEQNARKTEPANNRAAFGGARPATAARTGSADRAEDEKRDEVKRTDTQYASETRTIAGRHFRKQGGIWTDTAYDSSTATVNMTRNSEQFRALVADEAAIGTIARQLDGEVIVVWKGRAYHIR